MADVANRQRPRRLTLSGAGESVEPRSNRVDEVSLMASAVGEETVIDLRGLRCPYPVLRAKKAMRTVPVGTVLVLECTDPLSVVDVPHFVNQTGHELVDQASDGTLYVFRIRKRK